MDIIDVDLFGIIFLFLIENEDDWFWGDDGFMFYWVFVVVILCGDFNVLFVVGLVGLFYGV